MEEDRALRPLSSRGTDLGGSLEPDIGDQLSSPPEVSPTTFCSESSTTFDENFGRNKQLGSLEENRFYMKIYLSPESTVAKVYVIQICVCIFGTEKVVYA